MWRNRLNILQSTGKVCILKKQFLCETFNNFKKFQNFQKTIFPILQTIKAREDGSLRNKQGQVASQPNARNTIPVVNPVSTQMQPQQYNRYDQERFAKNDSVSGFSIDTTSTYHGLTLKSVTEGSTQPKTATPPTNNIVTNNLHTNNVNKPQKRVSRTPIIIIPATNTSLITMYNCKAILQDLKYVDSKSCDQRRENEILIQRRKSDNTTVPYRIIDNPLKLSQDDWLVF